MNNKDQAKELFAHLYNEKPADFKDSFTKSVKSRIMDKIGAIKSDINYDTNTPQDFENTEEGNEDEV